MGLPVEINNLMLGSLGGYTIGRSLRFRSSASAYLSRTFGASGNTKTWTFSTWMKRGTSNSYVEILSAGSNNTDFMINKDQSDGLQYYEYNGSTTTTNLITTPVFRDFSAWYHIMLCVDTTQATAANRVKIYVNGVQITTFSTATYPSQNATTYWNSNIVNVIGAETANSRYLDGYLAEINFVDGQQLTPSSFGAYDTNGVWQPKKYSGTYGTNGFYLPFSNTSSTATLGNDFSGNSNTWTVNNISLTAGTTYDSMIDSPTVSASSSNYCVMNPLLSGQVNTNAEGNLYVYSPIGSTSGSNAVGTMGVSSGKWYFEATFWQSGTTSFGPQVGITNDLNSTAQGGQTGSYAYIITGQKQFNGTGSAYAASYTTGDVIGVAFDLDAGTLTFYKNNVSQGTAFTGLSGTFFPYARNVREAAYSSGYYYNFGQRPFTYTPPTGFNALNTYNLPAPSIANGAQYMAATTFTGNASTNTINNGTNTTIGTSFQPDMVWLKSRSNANNHTLYDSIRGINDILYPNLTNAAVNSANNLTSFNSNGYTLGANENSNDNSGESSIGWSWKGGGTGVINNSGTITSTVSANTTAGFSVVTYSGNSATATVGHGLGVAPSMYIVKSRTYASGGWTVYHTSIGATGAVQLQSTSGTITSANWWNNTAPTSSVFSLAGVSAEVNTTGNTYVAYCFSAVRGYSAFGSYTGNGSTDGPFIYTGFRPRWILFKNVTTGALRWTIFDTSRNTFNLTTNSLAPSDSNAEVTNSSLDILSNGFKWRDSGGTVNNSGDTFIYAAFAENPFNISRAR